MNPRRDHVDADLHRADGDPATVRCDDGPKATNLTLHPENTNFARGIGPSHFGHEQSANQAFVFVGEDMSAVRGHGGNQRNARLIGTADVGDVARGKVEGTRCGEVKAAEYDLFLVGGEGERGGLLFRPIERVLPQQDARGIGPNSDARVAAHRRDELAIWRERQPHHPLGPFPADGAEPGDDSFGQGIAERIGLRHAHVHRRSARKDGRPTDSDKDDQQEA